MIPLNDVVKVYKGEEKDDWGIVIPSTEPAEYKTMVTYTSELVELKDADGKAIVVSATIMFKGKVDVDYSDEITIANYIKPDKRFKPLKIQPIMDLGRKQIFTKVVV